MGSVLPPLNGQKGLNDRGGESHADDFCWDAANDGVGGDIMGDDGSSCDDGPIPDGDAAKDSDVCPNPNIVSDGYGVL